jgi:hypothetical protein
MTCAPVVVIQRESPVVVIQRGSPVVVHVAGEQGPPGPPGVGAGGITYVQDYEPVGAIEKETWWNPLTLQLKVYHNNEFEPVSPDGGHF